MPPKIDQKAFDALGEILADKPPPPRKKRAAPVAPDQPWEPRLMPKQKKAFDSKARYLLAHGEKGSGKTMGLLHKLVRHAYENQNALCLILVRVKSMATKGGAWDKLTQEVLPAWRDGNRDKEGKLIDSGLGIEFTDVKMDSQHNEYLWVENRFGGWSVVILISAPHAVQLRQRIRGYEPSFVLVDELTSCDSAQYLVAVAAQVGRRRGIKIQQYTAACNPEGPSHWVYKKWFEECYDETTGDWDPDFEQIHIPISENAANLPDGYIENLDKVYRGDPIERARMMHGEWIDRPAADAIFRDVWIAELHVKPHPKSSESLIPLPDYPIIVGMDPGNSYNAFIFEQYILNRWLIFDEIVISRRRIRYDVLVPAVLRRVAFWSNTIKDRALAKGKTVDVPVVYVSDNSAFNQFRAASGSYDVLDIEKIAARHAPALGLQPVKVRQAPKFKGSVPARTRLTMDLLAQNRIIVSARCKRVIRMFERLEPEAQDPNKYDPEAALTPKRSDYIHTFDGLSYPILTQSISPAVLAPRAQPITVVRFGT